MSGILVDAGRLFRLYWAQERGAYQFLLFGAVIMPAMMCYVGLRIAAGDPSEELIWLAGGLTMGLGLSVTNQVGYAVLLDRLSGRLGLVRTAPLHKASYYAHHILSASLIAWVLILVGLALLGVFGLATPGPSALVGSLVVALAVGSSLGGLAALITTRVDDRAPGEAALALASFGLVFFSPVYYTIDALPFWLHPLAWLSPFTHAAELIRAMIYGQALPLGSLAGLLALAAVYNVVGYKGLRWEA